MEKPEPITEEQKSEAIKEFVRLTAEHALKIFNMFDLKPHIECMVKDDVSGEEYLYAFRKMTEGYVPRIDLLAAGNLKLQVEIDGLKAERDKLKLELKELTHLKELSDDAYVTLQKESEKVITERDKKIKELREYIEFLGEYTG